MKTRGMQIFLLLSFMAIVMCVVYRISRSAHIIEPAEDIPAEDIPAAIINPAAAIIEPAEDTFPHAFNFAYNYLLDNYIVFMDIEADQDQMYELQLESFRSSIRKKYYKLLDFWRGMNPSAGYSAYERYATRLSQIIIQAAECGVKDKSIETMRVFRDGITYDINKFWNTENGPDEKKFAFFVAKSLSGHNVGGRLQDNVIPSSDFGS